MNEILTNNYQWIFSGIGVAIIGWLGYYFLGRKKDSEPSNTINITNNVGQTETSSSEVIEKTKCDKTNTEFSLLTIIIRILRWFLN